MSRRWFTRAGVATIVLVVVAFAFDIPRIAWGILTYGKQRRQGTLAVGDLAPITNIHDMAGAEQMLAEWIGNKPLVLIFGSCT